MNLCIVNVQSSLDHCKLYSKQEVFVRTQQVLGENTNVLLTKAKTLLKFLGGMQKLWKKIKIYI